MNELSKENTREKVGNKVGQEGDGIALFRLRDALLGIGILLTVVFAGALLALPVLRPFIPMWLLIGINIVTPVLVLLLFPFWAAHRCGAGPLIRCPGIRRFLKEGGIGIGIGIATLIVLTLIEYAIFQGPAPVPAPFRQLLGSRSPLYFYLFCLLGVTVVPVAEELFFRGLIYGSLRRLNIPLGLAVQALLFAVAHQYGLVYTAFVFVGGVLLGLVYEWRRTLLTPILMHITWNTISMSLLILTYTAQGNMPQMGAALEEHPRGCQIIKVMPDSGAEEAGLVAGDVIISFNYEKCATPSELINKVSRYEAGQRVPVEVIRDGKIKIFVVTLKRRNEQGY